MTIGQRGRARGGQRVPDAALVAVHNEGWAHLKETHAQLEDSFAKLGAGGRLTALERGLPLRIEW